MTTSGKRYAWKCTTCGLDLSTGNHVLAERKPLPGWMTADRTPAERAALAGRWPGCPCAICDGKH